MYEKIRNLLGLDETMMILVIIAFATSLFQLAILVFYYKKPLHWFWITYLLLVVFFNVSYYKIFSDEPLQPAGATK